jgi:hypothetical protein
VGPYIIKKIKMKGPWKYYKHKGLSEMRPYVLGEDMSNISVSDVDDPEKDMGMIARNPENHEDMWYVSREYFKQNLELEENSIPPLP